MKLRVAFLALLCAIAFAGIVARADDAGGASPAATATPAYDPAALPSGKLGDSIRYGRAIMMDTHELMKGYVRARLDCAACHVNGGLKPRAGSMIGTYAYFPQYNKRSHRIITLQDRLAECFLYSMNGRPPHFASKEMIALVSYIAWISRGTPSFSTPAPDNRFVVKLPSAPPDLARGAATYAARCALCHRADGNGQGPAVPPLWGASSFNNGAGMAHIDRMTGFVYYNMPKYAPGSLSIEEAYDVAAFVLSHPRPKFDPAMLVAPSPLPAGYF